MDSDEPGLELAPILAALRRRAPLIAICVVVAAAVAFAISEIETREYTAKASLLFSETPLAQQVAGLTPAANPSTQQSIQDTNVGLAEIGDMAARTARALHHGLTEQSVTHAINVSAQSDTNIVLVAATSSSPHLAAAIANTYSSIFVAEQASAGHAYYAAALAAVQKQLAALTPSERASAQGLVLQDRALSLSTLAALPSGAVQLAAAAKVPLSPSSPRVARNTAIGAALGLLLALALVFWLERSDQRLRDPTELESLYGRPLLGVIPESPALARRAAAGSGVPPVAAEAFQLLRGHLRYFNVDRKVHTLLVVSASPGDGKTTVSLNLALAAAEAGADALLIDADLRRPNIARQLELDPAPGLIDVLIGAAELRDATRTIELSLQADRYARTRSLSVLVAGATSPPNPSELIESQAMAAVLSDCAANHDFIVIDSSPLLAVPDALTLLNQVDGVIVVGRLDQDRRDEARRLRQVLDGTSSPVLGVVANGYKSRRGAPYGSGYSSARVAASR
ncbi:MAG: polysaccharide biosynthesis tyrosine autokinase [Solirubrobacteraceae bacterium]|jgi:receptor protein-tyrosine kinase